MIRIMVLDDEPPALRQAERVLRSFPDVKICGLFTDPDEFLDQLRLQSADLVLLDMELPESHGLYVADAVRSLDAGIKLVFVTAYDEYAVKAFEVEALDYVMKPISEDRLAKTLQRYRNSDRHLTSEFRSKDNSSSVSIRCFDRLSIKVGQREATFINSKSEELLSYLIQHQGEPVSKDQIMEVLWPERDYVRTQANLYSTVYQLRKDLQAIGLRSSIEQSRASGGSYRFRFELECWDVHEFEQLYRACKQERFDLSMAERAIDLYRKGYLAAHDYTWSVQRREELEHHNAELLEMCVDDYVKNERYEKAMSLLQKLAELHPFNERIYAKMIALYAFQRRLDEARTYLEQVQKEITGELGIVIELQFDQIVNNPSILFH